MPNGKTILVTGGSGFIGSKLTQALLAKGYRVIIAERAMPVKKVEGVTYEILDLQYHAIPKKYDGELHAIIHLAGANIFGRWTEDFKRAIYQSRIESTRQIVTTIAGWEKKPSALITASAFGYYGQKDEADVDESASAGHDFLASVCLDWEREAQKAESIGVRTVQVRTANVVGAFGILKPLRLPFTLGLGAWIGKGSAWLPWVHVDDIVGIYLFALEHEDVRGPLNTAAPECVRQKDFMKTFGRALHRWVLFSIPVFVLQMRYGDLALTFDNSVKMNSKKLLSLGYTFKYPTLLKAMEDVV